MDDIRNVLNEFYKDFQTLEYYYKNDMLEYYEQKKLEIKEKIVFASKLPETATLDLFITITVQFMIELNSDI